MGCSQVSLLQPQPQHGPVPQTLGVQNREGISSGGKWLRQQQNQHRSQGCPSSTEFTIMERAQETLQRCRDLVGLGRHYCWLQHG